MRLFCAQQLEIHYINVDWGSSVFVRGPNGTTSPLEAGNSGAAPIAWSRTGSTLVLSQRTGWITPLPPQHCDHLGGLDEDEVPNARYDARRKNYYKGSTEGEGTNLCVIQWASARVDFDGRVSLRRDERTFAGLQGISR